jgi:hypothetical protein
MKNFEVFISYSRHDKAIASQACAALEEAGIPCWIAPRDVVPGRDWGESIITAIESARAMVLIFSAHANDSPQIKREVERAVHKGIPIIPMRIEDVVPSRSLEYFISTPQWLDAFIPPVQSHFPSLIAAVRENMAPPAGTAYTGQIIAPEPVTLGAIAPAEAELLEPSRTAPEEKEKRAGGRGIPKWVPALFVAAGVLIVGLVIYYSVPGPAPEKVAPPAAAPSNVAGWVTLPRGTRLVNRSAQSIPTFTLPDRSSQRSIDIRPGQVIPPSGSDELLARKTISLEDWIRFPVGESGKDAYVPQASVALLSVP